jgi:hypothetical protein
MEKEVFERMISEFEGVNEKVVKLRDFITNKEKFETLDFINRDLLIAQLKAMETYLSILSIRIGLNAKPTEEVAETIEE